MSKKITVLVMAVSVVAALALPATAPAAWKHHETPIAQDVQLSVTGSIRFQTGLGGTECQITSRAKFTAGSTTGHAETWVMHPTSETLNCKGLGGFAFCQVHNVTPQAPNWTLHTGSAETTQAVIHEGSGQVTVFGGPTHQAVLIKTQDITGNVTGGFCPVKHIVATSSTVAAFPNQPNTVSSVQLNGIIQTHKIKNDGQTSTGTGIVSGTLQIEDSAQRTTYSI